MQFTADSGFNDVDWVKREEKERLDTVFAEDQEEQTELEL
jgi:BMFP domain-containing protein YqiC